MQKVEFWPNDIECRRGLLEGKETIMIRMECLDDDPPVIVIALRPADFVAMADHMKDLADRLVANRAG